MVYAQVLDAESLRQKQQTLKKVIAQRELLGDAEMSRIRNKLIKQEANLNVVLPIFGILRGIFEDDDVYTDIYTEEGKKLGKVFKEDELVQKLKQAFLGDRKSVDKATLLEMLNDMKPKIANITQTQRTNINVLLKQIQELLGDDIDVQKLKTAVSNTNREVIEDAGVKGTLDRSPLPDTPRREDADKTPIISSLLRSGSEGTPYLALLGDKPEGASAPAPPPSSPTDDAQRKQIINDNQGSLGISKVVNFDNALYTITGYTQDGRLIIDANEFEDRIVIDPRALNAPPLGRQLFEEDDDLDTLPTTSYETALVENLQLPEDKGYPDYMRNVIVGFTKDEGPEKARALSVPFFLWKTNTLGTKGKVKSSVLQMGNLQMKGNASEAGLLQGVEDNSIRYDGKKIRLTDGIKQFFFNPRESNVNVLTPKDAQSLDKWARDINYQQYLSNPDLLEAITKRGDEALLTPRTRRQGLVPQPPSPTQGRGNPRNFAPRVAPEMAEFDAKTGLLNRTRVGSGVADPSTINREYISRKHTPLRVDKNGNLGRISIDMPHLINHLDLVIHDNDTGKHLLTRRNVPIDFLQLMTKRFNKNVNYSKEGSGLYRQVVRMAQIPLERTGKGLKQNILIVKKPADVVKRFESLIGHMEAGGNNKELKKEVGMIADYLLKEKLIDSGEMKFINNKYVI